MAPTYELVRITNGVRESAGYLSFDTEGAAIRSEGGEVTRFDLWDARLLLNAWVRDMGLGLAKVYKVEG